MKNLSVTAPPLNRVQGVIEVQNQDLYGSEPSITRTFEEGNMKLIQTPSGNAWDWSQILIMMKEGLVNSGKN